MKMHLFKKNGLFTDEFLNALISFDDESPFKQFKKMIYLNLPETSKEKLAY